MRSPSLIAVRMQVPPDLPLDLLPVACAWVDPDGSVRGVNERWRTLFAPVGDDRRFAGTALAACFPDEGDLLATLRGAATTGTCLRLIGRRRTGVPFTAAVEATVDEDARLILAAREVAGDELLDESLRYLNLAFDVAPVGMALFNTDGHYVRVNDALCRLLDRSREELLGRRDQEFTHPDDRQSDVDAAWRILNGELDSWHTDKRFVRPDGSVVWASANLVFLRDDAGRPLSWLGQFEDITESREREQLLNHLVAHDELTAVANRRGFLTQFGQLLAHARRYGETGALLALDLDGFKLVNDRDGHQAGDALLVAAARAIRGRVRATDLVARLGGDEFAVLLPHADATSARHAAEGVLEALRAVQPEDLRASCGVTLFGADSGDVETVLAAADRAMYAAKAAGGDRVAFDTTA